jgi:hypothetical protein
VNELFTEIAKKMPTEASAKTPGANDAHAEITLDAKKNASPASPANCAC